jgi:hypothetical protein
MRSSGSDGGLLEDALLGLREDVCAVTPHGFEQVPSAGESRIGEQRVGGRRIEGDPLQLEEDQRVLDLAAPFLDVLQQRAVARYCGVRGEQQACVRTGLRYRLVQGLEVVHGPAELVRRQARQPAAETALEILRCGEGAVEIGVDLRVVRPRVQVGEVPPDSGGERLVVGRRCHGSPPRSSAAEDTAVHSTPR